MAEERKNWLGPYIPQGSWIREIAQQAKLAFNLMLDRRVHPAIKLIPIAALIYVISPIDAIPAAVMPVLGQMDDVAIAMLGLRFFFELAPVEVVQEHLKRLTETSSGNWQVLKDEPPPPSPPAENVVVDGTYRVEEKKPEESSQ